MSIIRDKIEFANDNIPSVSTVYTKLKNACDALSQLERRLMDENISRISRFSECDGDYDKVVEYIETKCSMLSLKVKIKMIKRVRELQEQSMLKLA